MRKFTDGSGADSTAAVKALLSSNSSQVIFTAVKIQLAKWLDNIDSWFGGGGLNPSNFTQTFLLTDCPAAIKYTPIGTFRTAAVRHESMSFGIGLDFPGFEVVWSPSSSDLVSPGTGGGWFTVAPDILALEAACRGFFDGAFISVYKLVLPPFGNPPVYDANTYGACLLQMGAVEELAIEGGEIRFKVGCVVDQQNQQVPSQLIGPDSRFATVDPMAYTGLTQGSNSHQDAVRWSGWLADRSAGTQSASFLQANCDGSASFIPATGYFDGGFVVWQFGPLKGMRRPIARYTKLSISYASFQLAEPFPYDQTQYDAGFAFGFGFDAYALRRKVSTESSGTYNGFPYVPAPEDAF